MHSLKLKIIIFTIAERNSYVSCSRAIFGKSTDDGNDVIVAQFVVLFIVRANFRAGHFNGNGRQNCPCYNKKNKWITISHGLCSYRPVEMMTK